MNVVDSLCVNGWKIVIAPGMLNNDQSVAEVFHFYGFYPVINFNESKIQKANKREFYVVSLASRRLFVKLG